MTTLHLCPNCFANSILKRRIIELRRNRKLPNCKIHNRKGVPASEVAALVDAVLRSNYTIVTGAFGAGPGSSFHDLLNDITEAADDDVIRALSEALIENDAVDERDGEYGFYGEDQNYELIEPDGWQQSRLWAEFRFSITHDRRFFNEDASMLLEKIFDKVHFQSDEDSRPTFYAIDATTEIHRARRVRTTDEAEQVAANPAESIGPPPQLLRRAGRMNAAGIGAFYGALDEATCLAELRPPVGGLVCLSRFRPRRPIYVLDFTRFERPGRHVDIFAKNYASRTTQWAFMQSFQHEISKPILPDDEHLEYVPAQVVAEYLTSKPVTYRDVELRIEGLVFRSAQHSGGRNIVLFGDAGLVVGGHGPSNRPSNADFDFGEIPTMRSSAVPNPALEVIDQSFRVRWITSANYESDEAYLAPVGAPDF